MIIGRSERLIEEQGAISEVTAFRTGFEERYLYEQKKKEGGGMGEKELKVEE